MRDIEFGVTPNLPLLPRLQTGDEASPPSTVPKAKTDAPEWHKSNPGPVAAWALPSGKKWKDFFDTSTARGRKNIATFPRANHHDPKVTNPRNLCVRYQCEGHCRASCPMAHVRPSSMNDSTRKTLDQCFKDAYAS